MTYAPDRYELRYDVPRVERGRLSFVLKRAFDLVISLVALTLLFPLYLLIALAVALETRGPILFRQRRTGKDGQAFVIYKFRTMTVAEDGADIRHATRNDARVTRVGRYLRASSMDEIPQLLNVIKGDMSLVGPRPHAMAHDSLYASMLPQYNQRFTVRPGLTGLAQVNGLRGEIHGLECMQRRVEADILYARHWSFFADLVILARTVPLLLSRENAY